MALFFGYDPGGFGLQKKPEPASGVVAVQIDECGRSRVQENFTVLDAAEALSWFRRQPFANALGVDTLLCWSFKGHRSCDDWLIKTYGAEGVQQQNSLKGAMTIGGMMVAIKASQELGLPLVESHPKKLIRARSGSLTREGGLPTGRLVQVKAGNLLQDHGSVVRQYNSLLEKADEHQADAFIAAWCASRWYFRDPGWETDLYCLDPHDPLHFPAGPAVYPWPEPITSSGG